MLFLGLPLNPLLASQIKGETAVCISPLRQGWKIRCAPAGVTVRSLGAPSTVFRYLVDQDIECSFGAFSLFSSEKRWSTSLALSWHNFFIKRKRGPQKTVLNYAILQFSPVTHAFIGYSINQRSQILFGLTYLWGLGLEFRYLLGSSFYLSPKFTFWLDRCLSKGYKQGFHDAYFTLGLSYLIQPSRGK